MEIVSLFDDIQIKQKKESILELLKNIEDVSDLTEDQTNKILNSNKVDIAEKVNIIHEKLIKVLGKQKKNSIVINNKAGLHDYILKAIDAGRIDIDTETNNSLDPVTCKLMGLCLYYPGGKQAYVPVNHRDMHTKERLNWQVTEEEIRDELKLITESRAKWTPEWYTDVIEHQTYFEYWIKYHLKNGEKLKSPLVIMHNGKFDYEVIKSTCGIELPVDYDSMIASRLLNENDMAGLKYIYTTYIDKSQAKYNLEKLYGSVCYADSDPYLFALYAATDSMMTDKVFELQLPNWLDDNNERLRNLFTRIEMQILIATAEQELIGMAVDEEYGARLKVKYTKLLEELDIKIMEELNRLAPTIAEWRLTKEANLKTRVYVSKDSVLTFDKIEKTYPNIDEKGKRFKYGKAKVEQLPKELDVKMVASPTQLAILLYDILKCPVIDKESPRATGAEILEAINEKTPLPLIKLILDRRSYVKLISTYIDTIPTLVNHWPDHRIRFHLNQLGTDTGRFSSGGTLGFMEDYGTDNEHRVEVPGINIQNIPSYCTNIRALFVGETTYNNYESNNNKFEVNEYEEVETNNGYKYCRDLTLDDLLKTDDGLYVIKNKTYLESSKTYLLEV